MTHIIQLWHLGKLDFEPSFSEPLFGLCSASCLKGQAVWGRWGKEWAQVGSVGLLETTQYLGPQNPQCCQHLEDSVPWSILSRVE